MQFKLITSFPYQLAAGARDQEAKTFSSKNPLHKFNWKTFQLIEEKGEKFMKKWKNEWRNIISSAQSMLQWKHDDNSAVLEFRKLRKRGKGAKSIARLSAICLQPAASLFHVAVCPSTDWRRWTIKATADEARRIVISHKFSVTHHKYLNFAPKEKEAPRNNYFSPSSSVAVVVEEW